MFSSHFSPVKINPATSNPVITGRNRFADRYTVEHQPVEGAKNFNLFDLPKSFFSLTDLVC